MIVAWAPGELSVRARKLIAPGPAQAITFTSWMVALPVDSPYASIGRPPAPDATAVTLRYVPLTVPPSDAVLSARPPVPEAVTMLLRIVLLMMPAVSEFDPLPLAMTWSTVDPLTKRARLAAACSIST